MNVGIGVSSRCRPVYSGSKAPHHLDVVTMANILMNRTRSRLIRYLIAHGPASCSEVAAALNMSASSVRRHLTLLCDAGIIVPGTGTYIARPDDIRRELGDLAASFSHRAATPGSA
jgi:predicted transcriptional regulator